MNVVAALTLAPATGAQEIVIPPTTDAARPAGSMRNTPPTMPAIDSADRWRPTIDAFERADRLHPFAPGNIVFVGSSSIRLWENLETAFGPSVVVLKRGFGGSRMSDCKQYAKQLVVRYKPRLVVVYAGENDLAEGRKPQQVLEAFAGFVDGVRAALPDVRIAYVSIKPSPLRESLVPSIITTNLLIKNYIGTVQGIEFIDVYSQMVDASGRPRRELYRQDSLHLSEAGYALWTAAIASHLR